MFDIKKPQEMFNDKKSDASEKRKKKEEREIKTRC